MELLEDILKNNRCLKLICAAGNENVKEVEKLVYVYAMAGFNFFDICAKPDVIRAARSGLLRADKQGYICVSVGITDDIHVCKAVINSIKCNSCKKCINVCPQDAIFFEDDKYIVDEKKCIGCNKCIDNCSVDAIISEHKYKTPYTMLLPLLSEKIDCVEFHCSSENIELILENWQNIISIYKGQKGICLDRSKLGDDKIIELLNKMIKNCNDKIIIQADGRPMSGSNDDYKSTLQTVAFAELIRNANLPVYLLLSGGTNSKSTKLANEMDININGAALGSYARKIVKNYINNNDFFENSELQQEAINKAKILADNLREYLI